MLFLLTFHLDLVAGGISQTTHATETDIGTRLVLIL